MEFVRLIDLNACKPKFELCPLALFRGYCRLQHFHALVVKAVLLPMNASNQSFCALCTFAVDTISGPCGVVWALDLTWSRVGTCCVRIDAPQIPKSQISPRRSHFGVFHSLVEHTSHRHVPSEGGGHQHGGCVHLWSGVSHMQPSCPGLLCLDSSIYGFLICCPHSRSPNPHYMTSHARTRNDLQEMMTMLSPRFSEKFPQFCTHTSKTYSRIMWHTACDSIPDFDGKTFESQGKTLIWSPDPCTGLNLLNTHPAPWTLGKSSSRCQRRWKRMMQRNDMQLNAECCVWPTTWWPNLHVANKKAYLTLVRSHDTPCWPFSTPNHEHTQML